MSCEIDPLSMRRRAKIAEARTRGSGSFSNRPTSRTAALDPIDASVKTASARMAAFRWSRSLAMSPSR